MITMILIITILLDVGFDNCDENDNGHDDEDDDDSRLGATNVGGEYPSSSKVHLNHWCFGKQLSVTEIIFQNRKIM